MTIKKVIPFLTSILFFALFYAEVLPKILVMTGILTSALLYLLTLKKWISKQFNYIFFLDALSGIALLIPAFLLVNKYISQPTAFVSIGLIGLQLWVLRWADGRENKAQKKASK